MKDDESRVFGVYAPPPRLTLFGAALMAACVALACAPVIWGLLWLF